MTGPTDPRHPAGRLPGTGGFELAWQGWLPEDDPTGIVLISHGIGEHSGRYAALAEDLTADGWAVYAVDHRGHGRSTGRRVDGDHANWIPDLETVREYVAARHPGLPLFLLGHSMGGHIALAYALEHEDRLAGLVLSAPAVVNSVVPGFTVPVLSGLARLAPSLRVAGIDFRLVSKDPAVVAGYEADPLNYLGKPTLRLGAAVINAMDSLIERSAALRLPVLLQHGLVDRLVEPSGSRKLAERIGSQDLTVHYYEGLWHEIYNEPERAKPISDLREWLAAHRG